MNKTLLRSLLLGACCAAPFAAIAGGVEVAPCCTPPRVDIPDMREGWGFYLEGAAIRAYNNNTSYAFVREDLLLDDFSIPNVSPNWNFGIRVGVDYTLADSANVLKLDYEHIFDSNSTDHSEYDVLTGGVHEGDIKIKLDGVRLVSEQHILIGPYWEATLTGGLRYARVQQTFKRTFGLGVLEDPEDAAFYRTHEANMQFNGVGPLGGVGSMFHLTENLAIGGETQAAILLGKNDLSLNRYGTIAELGLYTRDIDSSNNSSLVPELFARIYGNYFYRFTDGMELQVELGWRLNQFFNLKDRYAQGHGYFDADGVEHHIPVAISDDIGFQGPYLSAHLKI